MSKDNSTLFFSINKKEKPIIFYISGNHSRNPKDEQFDFIRKKWEDFIKIAKKPAVVVEGRVVKKYKNDIEAIMDGGEIAFTTYLANLKQIPVFCFEPNRKEEMDWLAKHFNKEEIAYYYFARVVAQWHRQHNQEDIKQYLLKFLERDQRASGWDNFSFTIENIEKIHQSIFGNKLNLKNEAFFRKIENPTKEDNPLKKVVQASSKYRDISIINNIKKLIKEGYDLFIVYGKGHAKTHQKKLKEYI